MIKWYKIELNLAGIDDFVKPLQVGEKKICLIRNDQKLYAVQRYCPHAGGNLSAGWCKNGNLVCPIHRWEYSLESGRGAEGQGDCITTYPVQVRTDGIYIGLKQSFWKSWFS